jgi:hypothetical protein
LTCVFALPPARLQASPPRLQASPPSFLRCPLLWAQLPRASGRKHLPLSRSLIVVPGNIRHVWDVARAVHFELLLIYRESAGRLSTFLTPRRRRKVLLDVGLSDLTAACEHQYRLPPQPRHRRRGCDLRHPEELHRLGRRGLCGSVVWCLRENPCSESAVRRASI